MKFPFDAAARLAIAMMLIVTAGAALVSPVRADPLTTDEQNFVDAVKGVDEARGKKLEKRLKQAKPWQRKGIVEKAFKKIDDNLEIFKKLAKSPFAGKGAKAKRNTYRKLAYIYDAMVQAYNGGWDGHYYSWVLFEWAKKYRDYRDAQKKKKAEAEKRKKAAKKKPDGGDGLSMFSAPPWATSLALDVGVSSGSATGHMATSFGTDASDRSAYTIPSVGIDGRFPIANLGPNTDLAVGGWGRVFFDGPMTVARFDLHPTPGIDTFVKESVEGFLLAYLALRHKFGFSDGESACLAAVIGLCQGIISVFAGPRLQFNKLKVITDESGGGGVRNTFTRSQTRVGATVGADLEVPLGDNRPGMPGPFVRIGGAVDYTPSQRVTGTSTLGFNYDARVKGHVNGRGFISLGINF